MKLTTKQKQQYNTYLLDSIDFDGFDFVAPTNNKEKLLKFFEVFNTEVGYNIARIGEFNALTEYLQGLPSCINIVFTNYDILELAKKYGSLSKNSTDKEDQKILDNYFSFMANNLIKLKNKYSDLTSFVESRLLNA